ncbi:ABC transporter substrate-binding protein [Rhodococcus tukisamuensis]|uniref:NitT/TauT family transport system substrate-binding protein n=1 Tax=Rhodococcus tukisamuensis TaxID=168276 RepID=A0A1G6T5J4_9NOCA|nr:ABC transporter substrate-binding protein [Rhodococcus tukisamuensis]SDD24299.1 NitT/TauT family transport system substrate-binding protein [Rhodococcus tukisamuensis]
MKTRSRHLAKVVGALALAATLAACGSSSTAAVDSDGLTKLAVGNFSANTLTFPYVIANEQGLFKDEGIVTETVNAKSSAELTATLIGGSTQMAVGTPENVMAAMDQGQGLVAVAPFGKIDMALVVPGDSSITDVKQLAGKQIGVVQRGTFSERFAREILAQNGVDPEGVTYVAVGGGVTMEPALRSGKVDATVAATSSVVLIKSHGLDLKALVNTMDGTAGAVGEYGLQTFWTTTDAFKQANPDVVQGFCRAMAKATNWIADDVNRDAGMRSLEKLLDVSTENAGHIWDQVHTSWSTSIAAEQWQKNIEMTLGAGSTAVPFADHVDTSCK